MTKKIRVIKDFTYSSIIKEAISSSESGKATSAEIFTYITNKHPNLFKQSNSMTWKGNIRQLLSKSPEFVKLKKDQSSKLHYWKYIPYEDLFEQENSGIIPESIQIEPTSHVPKTPAYFNGYKIRNLMTRESKLAQSTIYQPLTNLLNVDKMLDFSCLDYRNEYDEAANDSADIFDDETKENK
ncbi:Forkhead transcription factor HCM1 [Astathelohania contejeani]|uniref:Forkhead transcription factor HCM1 n=1 Tax=Astathelohania contejeani TaxID=164912 RepID=A0ABQ7HVM1_9MICR|nr:Forkhead transcription factor HCM1 [Thelohania contejeani]